MTPPSITAHRRMQATVNAHVPVTAIPVDFGFHRIANLEGRRTVRRHVKMDARPLFLHRIGNIDTDAARRDKDANIARLAATRGIKDRAVEHDAAVGDGGDRRLARLGVGVVTEDFLGHGARLPVAVHLTYIEASSRKIKRPPPRSQKAIVGYP